VGVTPHGFAGDPRILYDPESQRWFAASLDFPSLPPPQDNSGRFLLAVSKTSDPTQGWQAVDAGPTFDFTELGINKDGVYLIATDATFAVDIVSIPKSDLLAATPTAANATTFKTGNAGLEPQPAVASDLSGSEAILSGSTNLLKISSIDSTDSTPTLDDQDRTVVIPQGLPNFPGATQKGSSVRIPTGNQSFGSNVVMQDGKLFGVETIALNSDLSHPGLRWFEIGSPLTAPVLLDSGIISPPGLDVYYGSIAVNPMGEVVIGFSGSGPDDYPSAYAVAGKLSGDNLTFGDPILLKAGVAPDTSGRFGDYSTTSYDPANPSHFWTIQEWTSLTGWSTEISEIDFAPPPPSVQTWFGGTGNFSDPTELVAGWITCRDRDPHHRCRTGPGRRPRDCQPGDTSWVTDNHTHTCPEGLDPRRDKHGSGADRHFRPVSTKPRGKDQGCGRGDGKMAQLTSARRRPT